MSHYKPYPAYKESGVEWLGKVPEHWSIVPLKWCFECLDGKRVPLNSEQRADIKGEVAYWGSGGVVDHIEKFIFDEPLVLLGEDGAPFFDRDRPVAYAIQGKSWINNHIHVLRPLTDYPITWFVHALNCVEYRHYIDGSTRDKLTQDDMKSISLVIPESPDEARRAVAHLSRETARIDALIEKKTRFIELLREKRQALITHAVTKGLDPTVKMKDSGVEWLGEVPEHWAVKRLKFIAVVQTGIAKGKDNAEKDTVEVPYLRVANVQDGYLDLDEVATIEVSIADLPRYLLQPGDVLMNEGGDFDKLGRGHVWHGEIEPCIHQNHVFAVRPHGVSSEWLNTFTSSAAAQFYFMGRSKQSTNLASISSSNLMELAVPLPCEEEQRLILDGLHRQASQVNALLAQTERSIELLKERRSALITAAVTGQIDLREAV